MKRVGERGAGYPATEIARLKSMVNDKVRPPARPHDHCVILPVCVVLELLFSLGLAAVRLQISDKKKEMFSKRINILSSFAAH